MHKDLYPSMINAQRLAHATERIAEHLDAIRGQVYKLVNVYPSVHTMSYEDDISMAEVVELEYVLNARGFKVRVNHKVLQISWERKP